MLFVALAMGFAMPPAAPAPAQAVDPSPAARSLRALLQGAAGGDVARFYAARAFRPVWFEHGRLLPAGRRLLAVVRAAEEHGLAAYPGAETLGHANAAESAEAQARADLALTRLLVCWIGDLHTPPADARMVFTDPDLPGPPREAAEILDRFARAGASDVALAQLQAMNPIYEELRASWRQAAGAGRPALARELRANMERARALPADMGERYVLVNVAAQELEVWDQGRRIATMPVIVGKRSEPTPMLAGLIRFAVLNPYWHMPPDLAAERVAPLAAREGGATVLARQNLELVSSFAPDAVPLDPQSVDWAEVAAGRAPAYLRQGPGPGNMMGQVKFIFPNRLGVYLHDTPLREGFGRTRRAESAGCVRLSDAPLLARLLLGGDVDLSGSGRPEERVDLPTPTPVYLVYFTLRSASGALERHPDLYGRDGPPIAQLATRR